MMSYGTCLNNIQVKYWQFRDTYQMASVIEHLAKPSAYKDRYFKVRSILLISHDFIGYRRGMARSDDEYVHAVYRKSILLHHRRTNLRTLLNGRRTKTNHHGSG